MWEQCYVYKHTNLISHELMEQQLMVVVECPVRH